MSKNTTKEVCKHIIGIESKSWNNYTQMSENQMKENKIPFQCFQMKETLMGISKVNQKTELGSLVIRVFSCFQQQVKLPHDLFFPRYIHVYRVSEESSDHAGSFNCQWCTTAPLLYAPSLCCSVQSHRSSFSLSIFCSNCFFFLWWKT